MAVQSSSYDLVLMDIWMPGVNGLDATREIRRMAARATNGRPLCVIALSADVLNIDRASCIEAGMNDFLAKPVRIGEMRLALQQSHESLNG